MKTILLRLLMTDHGEIRWSQSATQAKSIHLEFKFSGGLISGHVEILHSDLEKWITNGKANKET